MNIVSTVIKLTKGVVSAQKAGGTVVTLKSYRCIPVLSQRSFLWGFTPEFGLFYNNKAIKAVFDALPVETQKALAYDPEDGEFVDRVRFWQRELKPHLSRLDYYLEVTKLIKWCVSCKKRRADLPPLVGR